MSATLCLILPSPFLTLLVSPETLIISGHHGGGQFYGSNGKFDLSDLEDNTKIPVTLLKSLEKVKFLYLLGCHSATLYLNYRWKKILPSLKLVVGYEGQAPLGNKIQGHAYLSYFLKNI